MMYTARPALKSLQKRGVDHGELVQIDIAALTPDHALINAAYGRQERRLAVRRAIYCIPCGQGVGNLENTRSDATRVEVLGVLPWFNRHCGVTYEVDVVLQLFPRQAKTTGIA